MEKLFLKIFKIIILFFKNSWGVLNKPYETCRRLSKGENWEQVLPTFLIIFFYFSLSILIRKGLEINSLVLSLSLGKVVFGAFLTYSLILGLILFLGKLFGGKGSIKNIYLIWTYSLLPTLIWFSAVLVFYIFLPPPRTTSFLGQLFSFLFIAFSASLFLWKGILYYLALRFGMRLDLLKIIAVSVILFPAGFLYSILMYRLGIFRVPFV